MTNVCADLKFTGEDMMCAKPTDKCKYTLTIGEVESELEKYCLCSYGSAFDKYCPADTSSKFIQKLTTVSGVHTTKRHEAVRPTHDQQWPLFAGEADSCTAELLNSAYVKISFALLALLAIML
jgi:hypothetical protein